MFAASVLDLSAIPNAQRAAVQAETDDTPKHVKGRMSETLETMQMFDDWYRDMSRLPRGVQLAMLKLGSKIARFLPKG